MHFSRALILASAGLGLASPSSSGHPLLQDGASIDKSLAMTHSTAHIALDDYEGWSINDIDAESNPLTKRRNIDLCTANSARAGVCVAITAVIAQVTFGIAGLLKSDSNNNDCSAHSGQIDNVTWRVYASGRNCDTTAQTDTIQGAIADYLHQQGDNVCGVHCLKLTHGGTWTGYVVLAPSGNDLNSFYCGSSNRFGNCVSGGNGDAP